MDRGTWQSAVHRVTKSWTQLKQLSTHIILEFSNYQYYQYWASLVAQLAGKESICNEGDLGSIPGLERSPGERKGYALQYSGLENFMDFYSP